MVTQMKDGARIEIKTAIVKGEKNGIRIYKLQLKKSTDGRFF